MLKGFDLYALKGFYTYIQLYIIILVKVFNESLNILKVLQIEVSD